MSVYTGPKQALAHTFFVFFFFNDTAPPEIYTLSLHDALPICTLDPGLVRSEAPAGSVQASLNAMHQSLASVVSDVRNNADSVAVASEQIAKGNADLSRRTEQQASALQETAASMDELSSTVQQNAVNARQVNQLARGASQIAAKGGTVVQEVVGAMQDIHASSRQIGDIVGVIDSIAFQTNILALNEIGRAHV